MFNGPHGTINNKGMHNIVSNLKYLIEEIVVYNSTYDNSVADVSLEKIDFFR